MLFFSGWSGWYPNLVCLVEGVWLGLCLPGQGPQAASWICSLLQNNLLSPTLHVSKKHSLMHITLSSLSYKIFIMRTLAYLFFLFLRKISLWAPERREIISLHQAKKSHKSNWHVWICSWNLGLDLGLLVFLTKDEHFPKLLPATFHPKTKPLWHSLLFPHFFQEWVKKGHCNTFSAVSL